MAPALLKFLSFIGRNKHIWRKCIRCVLGWACMQDLNTLMENKRSKTRQRAKLN